MKPKYNMIVLIGIIFLVQFIGTCTVRAGEWFRVSASGGFLPSTTIARAKSEVGSQYANFEIFTPILQADYTLTSYSWTSPEKLPFNSARKSPWKELHQVSIQTMYGGSITSKWSYLMLGQGKAAFEREIEHAYLDGVLMGGAQYSFSERLNVLIGAGVKYTDFETQPFPAGGLRWDIGQGFNLSLIFPAESKISYTSINKRFSAFIDAFPETSAGLAYHMLPTLEVGLEYALSEGSTYRLDNGSLEELAIQQKYLKSDTQTVRLKGTYSPISSLACNVDLSYHFSRELSIRDKQENTIEKLIPADTFGAGFSLTYAL